MKQQSNFVKNKYLAGVSTQAYLNSNVINNNLKYRKTPKQSFGCLTLLQVDLTAATKSFNLVKQSNFGFELRIESPKNNDLTRFKRCFTTLIGYRLQKKHLALEL